MAEEEEDESATHIEVVDWEKPLPPLPSIDGANDEDASSPGGRRSVWEWYEL